MEKNHIYHRSGIALLAFFSLLAPFFTNAGNSPSIKLPAPIEVQNFEPLFNADWYFCENKGQLVDENHKPLSDIPFYSHQGGVNIYCKPGMISFVFAKPENNEQVSEATGQLPGLGFEGSKNKKGLKNEDKTIAINRANLVLLNANVDAEISATGQQPYYENYYTTGEANHGITDVHTYKMIIYKNIYPNIDMALEAKENGMEYSFIVHSGGNVADIQMEWKGLDNIKELNNGGIEYTLPPVRPSVPAGAGFSPAPTFTETAPVCYYTGTTEGVQKPGTSTVSTINSKFITHNSILSFQVSHYDKTKTLVIDPILDWGTYFGGNGNSSAYGKIACDTSDNTYISGGTSSTSGIATSGAYQTSYGGGTDVFLAKFSPSGTLMWATYYGGPSSEYGASVATDNNNNVYVTGQTWSNSGIATQNAYQNALGGNNDAFLAKFTSAGTLAWGTYLGGIGVDEGYSVATDANNNVFISGFSESNGLATSGAYQTNNNGGSNGQDGFVAKFDSSGSLSWYTYFGGSGDDEAWGIATDLNNNIYISGATESASLIATPGAYQTSYAGNTDGFIAKFTNSGSLSWASYFGGSGDEWAFKIATDNNGDAYICGGTTSTSGIATLGAYQTSYGGGTDDAYIAKFTSNGTSVDWATYLGGSGYDYGWDVAVDINSNVFLTGASASSSGIATKGAYQSSFAGGTPDGDGFISKFSPSGKILWSSYFGSSGDDVSRGITIDNKNDIYINGWTNSTYGIATSGGYQTVFAGSEDAFLAKFNICNLNANWGAAITNGKVIFTPNNTTATSYLWYFGDGDSSINQAPVYYYNTSGKYKVTLLITNSYGCTAEYDSTIVINISGISQIKPNEFNLLISPNPFTTTVSITYMLPQYQNVELTLSDITGNPIAILANESQNPGLHTYTLDAAQYNMAAGIYFLRMAAGGAAVEEKIVRIR